MITINPYPNFLSHDILLSNYSEVAGIKILLFGLPILYFLPETLAGMRLPIKIFPYHRNIPLQEKGSEFAEK
jgi:hypothetical protein